MAMALAAFELQKSERFKVHNAINDFSNGLSVKHRAWSSVLTLTLWREALIYDYFFFQM